MTPAQSLLIAVIYGAIYYVLARGAVGRVMDVDDAYKGRWTRPGLGANPTNSFAIVHIIFNMNLPKASYPAPLKLRIWTARVMLWLWPFVLLGALFVDWR
ncbi:hypothetical protein P3W24_09020 [Luteibacter sp. PPL201]|uniref:Uncharacterized protein n=1 Tax=Luteibacter sahnii TaxID=3021977 RepID=A0ABT6BAD8_9GAMM|nr:hypothetical protein [Luteibacter sp. PPL193]MDY1547076.1 hypothetical protein [Luteibacter sp. PPL193]